MTFVEEPGLRVVPGWHGEFDPDNVGASTTVRLADGRYRMYYRADDEDPAFFNRLRSVILSAVSNDGLVFRPEAGVRVDPADYVEPGTPDNTRFVDGPEAVAMEGGSLYLYFWGVRVCDGVRLAVSDDGVRFGLIEEVFPAAETLFRVNSGDPSILVRDDGPWLMYFGNGLGEEQRIWIVERRPGSGSA